MYKEQISSLYILFVGKIGVVLTHPSPLSGEVICGWSLGSVRADGLVVRAADAVIVLPPVVVVTVLLRHRLRGGSHAVHCK